MAASGKFVIRTESGKGGIRSSGKSAVYDGEGDCPECCQASVLNWYFTDQGFIDGGQDGAPRGYADPATVAASPWSILAGGTSLRLDWEDDYNCAEPPHNPYTQEATAAGTISVVRPTTMRVAWSGMAETQDANFELMELFVDLGLIGAAHAPGGGLGCPGGNGPVVSDPPKAAQQVVLAAGNHSIFISATTNDELYHVGAWYQFALTFT